MKDEEVKYKPLKFPNIVSQPDDIPFDTFNGRLVSSPKYDGNRGLCIEGEYFTSAMPKKPRNIHLEEFLRPLLDLSRSDNLVVDYEIYDPKQTHHAATSGILNSIDRPLPESLQVLVFDASPQEHFDNQCSDLPFHERIPIYHEICNELPEHFLAVQQRDCPDADTAERLFDEDLKSGTEGSIIRAMDVMVDDRGRLRGGWYKHGRATPNEMIGWKLKSNHTSDGIIIEVNQRRKMKEGIERERNAHGNLVQPQTQDSFELDECVGSLTVKVNDGGEFDGVVTEIGFGEGYTILDRRFMWKRRDELIGKAVEFSHMPHGRGDKLRHGKFLRLRPDKDPF